MLFFYAVFLHSCCKDAPAGLVERQEGRLYPQWSLQNRPMGMTRDGVVLPPWKGTRQARFGPPAPWAALEDVAVV